MKINEIKEVINEDFTKAKNYISEHKPQIQTAIKTAVVVGIPLYLKGYLFGYRDGMKWMADSNGGSPMRVIKDDVDRDGEVVTFEDGNQV